ncbi:hypothetical protein [Cytobacillus oceanisediminis]|uniref:hypothetical protein n=1 Tax=Cytobacillus oceanisediminis TaxID=665099 RepID=UPI0037358FF7
MYGEYDEIDLFIGNVIYFVENYTNFKTYQKMSPETKQKYINKLVLMIVFEYSPRKRYDISMETLRHWIRNILEVERTVEHESEES